MKTVAKYNVFKGISLALTASTPIVALLSCSELFVHRSDTAISVAGIVAIVISCLFFKDKLLENFKLPSPFMGSLIGLIIIQLIKSIIYPIETVLVATVVVTAVDTITFRRMYKNIERKLPDNIDKFKHFGFITCKTEEIMGEQ